MKIDTNIPRHTSFYKTSTQSKRLPRWLSGKKKNIYIYIYIYIHIYIYTHTHTHTHTHTPANEGDMGLIPGLERSPGEGNGYPHQYSCLEHPMDRATWWATVHGVAKSQA